MRWYLALLLLAGGATPAAAQSTYVGASLVGDIGRFSKAEFDDEELARLIGTSSSNDGEALGVSVRLGREITERWGVELEFARTGTFESRSQGIVRAVPERLDLTVPAFEFESERQHTMIAVMAFARQSLGDRVQLSYGGGVSFNQVRTEEEYSGPRILIFPPPVLPNYETTFYNVGPTVGLESAVTFGRAAVTAGIRLQSATIASGSGWLIRPSVGMRWNF
jgi:hypothetical protein